MNPPKRKALTALKKAHSHLGKVTKMLEGEKYCVDIIQQNLAVMGLLKSANRLLLKNHLETCFSSALSTKNTQKKKKMIDEVLAVSHLSNK